MKKLLVGLLAIASVSSYASKCNIKELGLLYNTDTQREMLLGVISNKGYTVDASLEGIVLNIGVLKLDKLSNVQGYSSTTVTGLSKTGNFFYNFRGHVHNASKSIADSTGNFFHQKRSEYLTISYNGVELTRYQNTIKWLASTRSGMERIAEILPECENL